MQSHMSHIQNAAYSESQNASLKNRVRAVSHLLTVGADLGPIFGVCAHVKLKDDSHHKANAEEDRCAKVTVGCLITVAKWVRWGGLRHVRHFPLL